MTEWTKFVKEVENVEIARRNTQLVPMGLSAVGSQDQQFQGNCSWCGIYGHVARDSRKNTEYLQNNQASGWSGTDDKKTKASRARARRKANKTKVGAHARTRSKERVNNMARKESKNFTRWRGTKTRRKHKPVKNTHTQWADTVGITLTGGLMQTAGRAAGAQICGLTLHGNKRHDSCHRRNRLKNRAFQCWVDCRCASCTEIGSRTR